MISSQQACEIIQKKLNDKCRIISCSELKDVFEFEVVPRRWNGDLDDYPCGGYASFVDKRTGEYKTIDYTEFAKKYYGEYEVEVDITPFLSSEDARFVGKIQEARKQAS